VADEGLRGREGAAQNGRVEGVEDAAGSPRSQQESEQLNRRQRARMADLSLLLDVILKTTSTRSLISPTGELR
jgi:hypothetical protein